MLSSVPALLAAVLVAAAPGPDGDGASPVGDAFAASQLPAEQLEGMILEALPPPPLTVVRETRYYGTVTIDHRAHLARRAACKTCHGAGAVSKIEFTAKVAHDRCIGCHQQVSAGPVSCQGCHVKSVPIPVQEVAAADAVPVPLDAMPPPPNPDNLAAALAALRTPPDPGGLLGKEAFYRYLEVGLAAGRGQGVSVRIASHQNFVVVTQSVERMMSDRDARTIGMLGAGISHPIHSRVSFEVVGLAGFDALDRPLLAMLPAIGGRTGLEWRPHFKFLKQLTASVTGVHDLSTRRLQNTKVGGTTIYGTVATGFTFPPK